MRTIQKARTVVVISAAMLALAGCASPPGPGKPTPAPVSPSPSSTRAPAAVYYTLTPPNGAPRLVREFHGLLAQADTAGHVRAAVTQMLAGQPFDPDYTDLWPAGARVRDVTIAGDVATVDLAGAATANLGAQASMVALQQLVWTVTAVPGISAVKIMLDGRAATELWGHLDIARPQRRAAAADVLYLVWLISPQHGDRVGRRVTLHIAGIAFEATVNYEIKHGNVIVKQGFVTLNAGPPAQGENKQIVDLDQPGTYTITAFEISPHDGSHQWIDDHVVTVG